MSLERAKYSLYFIILEQLRITARWHNVFPSGGRLEEEASKLMKLEKIQEGLK